MRMVQEYKSEIITLCERHNVDELYVFGSVLTNSFSKDSDIDFLVKFGEVNLLEYFDNYMDFKESLETLLNRNIDLIEIQTLKNPILMRSVDNKKILLYGRKDSKVVV